MAEERPFIILYKERIHNTWDSFARQAQSQFSSVRVLLTIAGK